ncbi:MAG: response regulator [Sulfuritalea sp.]|nr:response regulator [Sulfuritalea sp.]
METTEPATAKVGAGDTAPADAARSLFVSLRARLLLLVAVALVPAFALTFRVHYQQLLDRQAELDAAAQRIAHSRALEFGEKIADTKSLLAIIAGFPTVRADPSLVRCSELLADMKRNLPVYGNLGVVKADGTLVCSATPFDREKPLRVTDRRWFRDALETRRFVIGDYLVGRITGLHSLTFGLPVFGAGDEPAGVAFAALDLGWLSRFVAGLTLPEDSALLVLDRDGRILARHPDHAEWVGKTYPQAAHILAAAAASAEGLFDAAGVDAVVRRGAFARVPGSNGELTVLFGRRSDIAVNETRSEFGRSLAFMAAILLASFALAWLTAEVLVLRRTRRLAETANRLAAGDLAARSGLDYPDEIGKLAGAFDAMADAVAEREDRLARTNRALRIISASNRTLLTRSDDATLLDAVCRLIVEEGGFAAAWIGRRHDDAARSVGVLASYGIGAALAKELETVTWDEAPSGRGPVGTAIREQRSVVVPDIAGETALADRRAAAAGEGIASAAALPLMVGDEVWGAIGIFSREQDAFSADEIALLGEAASDLAFGLTTLRLQAREEVAREASRLKSEFLASMSHELRTPLNAIIGFSEVLRDGIAGEVSEQQREYLGDILNSGTHLLELINDILDLSKVESGKMALELEWLEVENLLHSSLSIVRERAVTHRLTLELQAADAGALCADPRKLKQIAYNLLSNAVKFTPDGGRVTVTARRLPARDVPVTTPPSGITEFVEIAVTDNGIGIAREDQARLFAAFTQIDSSLSRRHEGTGLGLALVKRLAELHGGAVGIESAPGKGSTFRVWLPCRPQVDCPDRNSKNVLPTPNGSRRVLVVEDDPRAGELLRLALTQEGFAVIQAASADEARQRLVEQTPDLITLDILLPDEDGWQLLDWLKQSIEWAHIPVVVVSIVAQQDKGFALGACAVLQKPFTKEELVTALARSGFVLPQKSAARVLVVDDEPSAVERIAAPLEAAGHSVARAYGGREALASAFAAPPDLILLDLMMPDLSGFDVVAALRADARTALLPIIIVTAKTLDAAERRSLDGQVQTVIEKGGFSPSAFLAEVHRALAPREAGSWHRS